MLLRTIAFAGAAMLLAGCAGTELGSTTGLTPSGTDFTKALYAGYVDLSKAEYAQGDYDDSDDYALRAQKAARGEVFDPEPIDARPLPPEAKPILEGERKRLMAALPEARTKVAKAAAKAQTSFDCWMEQQEENFQPKDIAACRDAFYAAMAEVDTALRPAPAPAPRAADPKPANFKVYFAFNSDKLNAAALATIDAAAAQAKGMATVRVVVAGYTDSAGANAYNKRLAKKRSDAVAAALRQRGIKTDDMYVSAIGETDQAVATKDNVREAWNRRVEITVTQ
ncbi:MAG: OmpA family protein [Alphaproteobacteria bacterium]